MLREPVLQLAPYFSDLGFYAFIAFYFIYQPGLVKFVYRIFRMDKFGPNDVGRPHVNFYPFLLDVSRSG